MEKKLLYAFIAVIIGFAAYQTFLFRSTAILSARANLVAQKALTYQYAFESGISNLGVGVETAPYNTTSTYTSSTIVGNTATELMPRARNFRVYGRICNVNATGTTAWLFRQSTSTGVAVRTGHPIASSTLNIDQCFRVGQNDPYFGAVWGIADSSTTLAIEYNQY